MAHDVFISYASQDKPTADAACAALEAAGVRCWIAPRDILPGREWSAAIVDAIEGARIMVLVFSARSNTSNQIVRELERAVNHGLTIIPLRIEDVMPGRNLEYFLSTPHWLDAMTPPLEQHLDYLTQSVQVLLGSTDAQPRRPTTAAVPTGLLARRELLIGAGGVAALAVLAFATGIIGGGGDDNGGDGGTTSGGGLDSRLTGQWKIDSALANTGDGSTTDWRIDLKSSGEYSGSLTLKDEGSVQQSGNSLTLTPSRAQQGYIRSVDWTQSGDTAKVPTAQLIPPSMLLFYSAAGSAGANSFLIAVDEYKRSGGSGSSLNGRWQHEVVFGVMHWQLIFEVTNGNRYTLDATLQDSGRLTARDGSWRQASEVNGIQEGSYEVVDKNTILFRNGSPQAFGPTAQVTWRRM